MDNPTPRLGTDEDDAQVLQWFKDFLAIPTFEPKPDYHVALLQKMAQGAGFECEVWYYDPARPLLLVTWPGSEPSLPALLLNSHMDVVPALREFWHSDPFVPLVRDNGDIIARGTQDMKCVCIQYLESLRRLRRSGFKPRRTIRCTFVPDEEIGGGAGMKFLSQDKERLKKLNIGLVLDEGLASPNNKFKFFYGERVPWWIKVTAKGPTGHGSQFIPNTAVSKLNKVIAALLEYREAQKEELAKGAACGITLGDVTTVNVSYLKAGTSSDGGNTFTMNVVPNSAEAGFDIRIAPQVDIEQFRKKLNDICSEEGVSWMFVPGAKDFKALVSALTPENPWWIACDKFFRDASLEISTEIFPAGTDAAFLRNLGYIAFGFSPINNTPLLLHDHNEFLNAKTFCRGVEIYNGLIASLASLPAHASENAV